MSDVLLVGKDWAMRALLRAELLEEGVEVEAHETIGEATKTIQTCERLPALLIVDLAQSDDPAAEVELLSPFAQLVSVWIITGQNTLAPKALQGHGFERVLLRPLEVGVLVEQIKRRVKELTSGTKPTSPGAPA